MAYFRQQSSKVKAQLAAYVNDDGSELQSSEQVSKQQITNADLGELIVPDEPDEF